MAVHKNSLKNLKSFGVDKPVQCGEIARENGRKGGKARAANRVKKMTIAEAVEAVLSLPVQGKAKDALRALGVEDEELTNAVALMATLFADGMNGDKKAIEMFMQYALQVSEDKRKNNESSARVAAMAGGDVNVVSESEEGSVVIYLPAIADEDTQTVDAMEKSKDEN